MKKNRVLFYLFLLISTNSWATIIDFETSAIDVAANDISIEGVTVSFDNLMTLAEGSSTNAGFGGVAGPNVVVDSNKINFSGNFITALGYNRGQYRAADFIRTISFDSLVSDVSLYIADIDSGSVDLIVQVLGVDQTILSSFNFAHPFSGDSLATLIDFGNLAGISAIQIIGDDPIGIDNISFNVSVPEPAALLLLSSGILLLWSNQKRRS